MNSHKEEKGFVVLPFLLGVLEDVDVDAAAELEALGHHSAIGQLLVGPNDSRVFSIKCPVSRTEGTVQARNVTDVSLEVWETKLAHYF